MESIISAAITTGADAIHPGFGFLSENTSFCKDYVKQCNITYVGPNHTVIENLGNKATGENNHDRS